MRKSLLHLTGLYAVSVLSLIAQGCTSTPDTQPKADSMSTVEISFADLSHVKDSSSQFELSIDSEKLTLRNDSSYSANSHNLSLPDGKHTVVLKKVNDTANKSWEIETQKGATYLLQLRYFKLSPDDTTTFDRTRPTFEMECTNKKDIIIR